MNKDDIDKRLGQKGVDTKFVGRLLSDEWKCSQCQELYQFDIPVLVPAPCRDCGGIVFETVRARLQ